MTSNTKSQPNSLAEEIINNCVVNTTINDKAQPCWEEFCLLNDIKLLVSIAHYWKKELSDIDLICPVGKSGLTIGVAISHILGKKLIWIDNEGRVIPRTREIRGSKVAVIDSHSFLGAHFNLAFSRLESRKAAQIKFLTVAICDNHSSIDRLKLPSNPSYIISVKKYEDKFKHRIHSLGYDIHTNQELLESSEFWGKN